MTKTNLDLRGEGKWGQRLQTPLYSDGNGGLFAKVQTGKGIRCEMVPYRQFVNDFMGFNYIIERN